MAIYHLNAKIISRSNGKSATSAAAYRAGEKIYDERTGLTFDYTRKRGVYATEILAPENAPNWVGDRAQLWNAAELIEKRCNSRTAREFDIALPVELTHPQKQELVRGFATENFVNKGLVADIAFHDINSHNPHVHIMITTRAVDENGLGAKDRNLDRKDFLLKLRESWANHVNQALESIGIDQRVDHRTLEEQGVNRIPQIHLGPNVAAMKLRGIVTERGDEYDRIQEANEQIETLETQLATVEKTIQATSQSSGLTLSKMLTNQPINDDGDEREREASTESDISEQLRRLNEAVIESNRQAEESRQRLQNLSERLRGNSPQSRKSGKSKQPSTTEQLQTPKPCPQQPTNQVQHPQQQLRPDVERLTTGEEGNKYTPGQRDHYPPVNPSKIDSVNHGDLQSGNLGINQAPTPQQQPNKQYQGAGQQHRNQTQPPELPKSPLTHAQMLADLDNLEAMTTIRRLMRFVNPEPQNGVRTFSGKRYIFHVSTDEQTIQLHAKDGRGLIFERKDGQVKGNLSDEDRKMIHDVNSEISRRIAQLQREREQREKQRRRGRGFSR